MDMVSWLSEAIAAHRRFVVGELTFEPAGGGWRLHGPRATAAERLVYSSADSLRQWVRFDEGSRYRPLSGARSLPPDWATELPGDAALCEALETIYPLAACHVDQLAGSVLRTCSLDEVLARQSGRYESASALSEPGRIAAVNVLCGRCVRTPVWNTLNANGIASSIPCPEPCSVMVSLCREAATWENDPPQPVAADPSVGFAGFETPGNELRDAWLGRRFAHTDQGED
jgi:hypothetical protein